MTDSVSVTRDIAAPAEAVISLLSDVTRVGEWSPETRSGRWLGGATGARVGARFSGTNTFGRRRWTTRCEVTASDPTHFAFHVTFFGIHISDWEYVATPTGGGCSVTETWVDRRRPFLRSFGGLATGVQDRLTHNRAGMEQTLAAVAREAERH